MNYLFNALNSVSDYVNSHPQFLGYYNYILNIFNDFSGTAIQTEAGQTLYAVAQDNRDDIIHRVDSVINIIREILDPIHPHYMDELNVVFPD